MTDAARQRQPPQLVKTLVVGPSEVRAFRAAYPKAKMVGWPCCNARPARYVYQYTEAEPDAAEASS